MSIASVDTLFSAKPPIRWAGGKSRLLKDIRPFLPEEFGTYYEPFVGGGAVFLDLRPRIRQGVLADLNEDLVAFWASLRDAPDELHKAYSKYVGRHSEEFYYSVRARKFTDSVKRAAHFLYLNRSAWNGLYRVNRFGEFNVPWGDRELRAPDVEDFRTYSVLMQDVDVRHEDFRSVLDEPAAGDLVYLDPPYLSISDTSKFNGYTAGKFRVSDMADLAVKCEELDERGVGWVLSNRDSEVIRDLFGKFRVHAFTVRRSIAAQNKRDVEPSASPEVIITNLEQ